MGIDFPAYEISGQRDRAALARRYVVWRKLRIGVDILHEESADRVVEHQQDDNDPGQPSPHRPVTGRCNTDPWTAKAESAQPIPRPSPARRRCGRDPLVRFESHAAP